MNVTSGPTQNWRRNADVTTSDRRRVGPAGDTSPRGHRWTLQSELSDVPRDSVVGVLVPLHRVLSWTGRCRAYPESNGPITSQCTGPGLALLAPAGDRGR